MSTNNETRVKEANECIQRAEKQLVLYQRFIKFFSLKTSIWKLKKNYDSAAYDYERAAICFRNAENLQKCSECYLKAAQCYASNKNLFHEAKLAFFLRLFDHYRCKESAAMACKEAKDFNKAAELFQQSAETYLHSGSMDTAAHIIDRAAKMMENISPEKSIEVISKFSI